MLHKDIKNSASNSTSSGTDDSEGEVVTQSTIGLRNKKIDSFFMITPYTFFMGISHMVL